MQPQYLEDKAIIQKLEEVWGVGITNIGEPYYAGYALVDSFGKVLAFLRTSDGKPNEDGFALDIRRLTDAMPLLAASGKKLILVGRYSDKLLYAVFRPGIADFYPYIPRCEEQLPHDEYWRANIPWRYFRPLGQKLPRQLICNLGRDRKKLSTTTR